MKKDSLLQKSLDVFSKNYLKMQNLFWDHERPSEFIRSIVSIRKDLGIPEDLPFIDLYNEADNSLEKFYLLEDEYRKVLDNFKKGNVSKVEVLSEGVTAILKTNHLGTEWEEMVNLAIVTGACSPPAYSVSISYEKERRSLTFTINKDTTKSYLI